MRSLTIKTMVGLHFRRETSRDARGRVFHHVECSTVAIWLKIFFVFLPSVGHFEWILQRLQASTTQVQLASLPAEDGTRYHPQLGEVVVHHMQTPKRVTMTQTCRRFIARGEGRQICWHTTTYTIGVFHWVSLRKQSVAIWAMKLLWVVYRGAF